MTCPSAASRLYREQRLLVHCPAQGQYKAFSAQCTHAGCVLDKIEDGEGSCPCHGSRFDVTTGRALKGPATVPLPEVPVTVKDGSSSRAPRPEGPEARGPPAAPGLLRLWS